MEPPPATGVIDPETGVLNAPELADYSRGLANVVEAALERGDFPLILGGDCSILLGSALALKRRGRYGLLFLDGNADFFQPEANPNGEAASMDLAFATGHAPGRWPIWKDAAPRSGNSTSSPSGGATTRIRPSTAASPCRRRWEASICRASGEWD